MSVNKAHLIQILRHAAAGREPWGKHLPPRLMEPGLMLVAQFVIHGFYGYVLAFVLNLAFAIFENLRRPS